MSPVSFLVLAVACVPLARSQLVDSDWATVPVTRVQMPDGFFASLFEIIGNATNVGVNSSNADSTSRRLASTYCAAEFSDMEGGYVWLGDDAIASETSESDDPHYDSDGSMFVVHNAPASTIAAADELCVELEYSAGALNINEGGATIDLGSMLFGSALATASFTCENCYAKAGAVVTFGMRCYTETTTADNDDSYSITGISTYTSTYCDMSAKASGAFEYNVDLQLKDPAVTSPSNKTVVVTGPTVPLVTYGDSNLLEMSLVATPSMSAEVVQSGVEATGQMNAVSSAIGSLSVEAKVDGDATSGYLTIIEEQSLEWEPLTMINSGFTLSASPVAFVAVIYPEITFTASITSSFVSSALLEVELVVGYPVTITVDETACTSDLNVAASAEIINVGSPFLDYTADLTGTTTTLGIELYGMTTDNLCFANTEIVLSGTTTTKPLLTMLLLALAPTSLLLAGAFF